MIKPAKPLHDRKLGIIEVSLTMARIQKIWSKAYNDIQDELEAVLIESNFFEETPFSWITLAIRYGLKDESKPHYMRINKKYGDLPLGIEVSVIKLQETPADDLKRVLRYPVLIALIHAGEKYGCPVDALKVWYNKP